MLGAIGIDRKRVNDIPLRVLYVEMRSEVRRSGQSCLATSAYGLLGIELNLVASRVFEVLFYQHRFSALVGRQHTLLAFVDLRYPFIRATIPIIAVQMYTTRVRDGPCYIVVMISSFCAN